MERRLAAILAADAVGYSRMMREDEPGALALLHKHRAEVIDPGIAKHRGRIVKLMGDGLLAEFSSVPPLVKTGNWLNHLEYDWEMPVWRHFLLGRLQG